MGWKFHLRHANTLAWLTYPHSSDPPDLQEAHRLIVELGKDDRSFRNEALISHDPDWVESIVQPCREYFKTAQSGGASAELLRTTLRTLRENLRDVNLFVLGVAGDWATQHLVDEFLYRSAMSSEEHVLFLLPRGGDNRRFSLLEPFPAFSKLGQVAVTFPALLFWSPLGGAHLASFIPGVEFYQQLIKYLPDRNAINDLLQKQSASEKNTASFLHLSDLHLGAEDVIAKQTLLVNEIHELSEKFNVKQSVITGDLMDGPSPANRQAFQNFRNQISQVLGTNPVVILGNHDQRNIAGSYRENLREASRIDWSTVVIDEQLKMIFLCFDSGRDASHARGVVTREQCVEVKTELGTRLRLHPDAKSFQRVALVHHHPYTFPEKDTGVWRVFRNLGFNRESLLRMDDSEQFVSWCALNGIELILHGHKHVPYHVLDQLEVDPATGRPEHFSIRSVGCGSSTGVGNWPMSANLLSWNPETRLWSISFLIDRGDGSGFREAEIAIRDELTVSGS